MATCRQKRRIDQFDIDAAILHGLMPFAISINLHAAASGSAKGRWPTKLAYQGDLPRAVHLVSLSPAVSCCEVGGRQGRLEVNV
jgi:hypothetical protein